MLLTSSKSINPSANNNAAIQEAIKKDNSRIVSLLIEHRDFDADLLIEDRKTEEENLSEYPILSYAIIRNQTNIVKLLLNQYNAVCNPAEQYNLPIRLASRMNNWDIVKLLLQYPNVDPATGDELPYSMRESCPRVYTFNQPLTQAAHFGNLEMFRLLMSDIRVNNGYFNGPLTEAVFGGNFTIATILLDETDVDPSLCGNLIIGVPSEKGNAAFVQRLLAFPQIKNDPLFAETALNRACCYRQLNVIATILNNSSVNARAIQEEMYHLKNSEDADILKLLLEHLDRLKTRNIM
jgi:ankyrin repeat protein